MPSSRALYRSRQVWHALWPHIDETELAGALLILNTAQQGLFLSMERRDQRHAIEVMSRLRVALDDHDMLVAALLHDCGKGAVPVWLRILNVVSPTVLRWLAKQETNGWRGAAYRLSAHPGIAAGLVEATGASATTVRLIACTPAPGEQWKAMLLEAADDAS
jgi:hypothetical protein